jgi:hypothetical protein
MTPTGGTVYSTHSIDAPSSSTRSPRSFISTRQVRKKEPAPRLTPIWEATES